MNFNREKVAAALALLVLVAGIYQVAVGLVTPRPDIQVPDTRLPAQRREVAPPRFPYFKPERVASRNPFSFSEGWRRLETLPLDAPPVPGPAHVVPLVGPRAGRDLEDSGAAFLHLESRPRQGPGSGGLEEEEEEG